ncbi:MAG: hypothetical protein NTV40_09605 [Solirubrobacterales bacterium]|nr:hypothetical protein [Solirubrobacterales bacterium]
MALFFIRTDIGQVATQRQLIEAKIAPEDGTLPPPPWFLIRATGDATTLWYAVMRKQTKGVFIGSLCVRHGPQHASLLQDGWHEVAVGDICVEAPAEPG